ncbi:hypothetical protein [Alkalimonas sp.]|uniref:hypothetical protein n=1 Tax=Alkalimonas sp. TaxID=1872453 RepID=UPI00263AE3C1|nr:hypothetical protein [Alkalimonas sp.]MCC5827154.1 hypothetical protein [Alkalimonas sp.]
MQKIPTLPKQSKVMAWLKSLPVSLQIVLIVSLLYLTWHFRYYTDGVDEAELTKVEGVLYAVECIPRVSGSDSIILHTSFPEQEVWFSGWQKCKNISDVIAKSQSSRTVTYYIKRHLGIMSPTSEGTLWIYAVDLVNPNKPLIHPARGLGIHYNPNPWCLAFFFIALALIEALRERWVDYKNKQQKQKAQHSPHSED